MKKVLNTSQRIYRHQVIDEKGVATVYMVEPNKTAEVPDDIAELWARSDEIQFVGATSDEKDAEIARLKEQLAKQNAGKVDDEERKALLEEATALGLKGLATAKVETLKRKIAEVKQAQGDSGEKAQAGSEE